METARRSRDSIEPTPNVAREAYRLQRTLEAARLLLDRMSVPVIFLTAFGEQELVQRAALLPVMGYLVKPVAPADLRETLERVRRIPREDRHAVFITRHALAEARIGTPTREEEMEERLAQLISEGTTAPPAGAT